MNELSYRTPGTWAQVCVADMETVLSDHAHCEKKAAASAMSLVNDYPQHACLVRHMAALAIEELRHFRQVHKIIVARGSVLRADLGDPYVKALRASIRQGELPRLLDRLLVSALIEARSCERLRLLATALQDAELQRFYAALATCERGHASLFVRLAKKLCGANATETRLQQMRAREAEIAAAQPLRPRIH